MSEPMTSGEIEDVLSSIRRLVSEDLRPQARIATPVAPTAAPAVMPDREKLMLTPALRVVADTVGAPEARFVEVEESEPDPEPTQRLRLDSVVASIGAAVSPQGGGWEPETGDATVTRLPWAVVSDRTVAEPAPDAALANVADEMPVRTVAVPVDADPQQAPQTAPGQRLHFAQAALRTEAVVTGTADAGDEPSDDPAIELDEAALRDLVRGLIRDELQGPLGERITRNIRKLVRAEIARMQATRDLD